MTTACWSGKHLAADRMIDGWQQANKIFPLPNRRWLIGAGNYDDLAEVAAWYMGGASAEHKPDVGTETSFLIASSEGAWWLSAPYLREIKILDAYAAVGSGAAYALGALASGKSARQAVEIASRFDPQTGNGVDCVALSRKTPKRGKAC